MTDKYTPKSNQKKKNASKKIDENVIKEENVAEKDLIQEIPKTGKVAPVKVMKRLLIKDSEEISSTKESESSDDEESSATDSKESIKVLKAKRLLAKRRIKKAKQLKENKKEKDEVEVESVGEEFDPGIAKKGFTISFLEEFVTVTFERFSDILTKMISLKSRPNLISLKDYKFRCGQLGWNINELHIEDVIKYKIPLFDLMVYIVYREKYTLSFKVSDKLNKMEWGLTSLNAAVTLLFFNLMVRGKIVAGDTQHSALITKYLGIETSEKKLYRQLSVNKMNFMDHTWIKTIKISSFSPVLVNRLKLGICGHRLLNIFANYRITKKDIPDDVKALVPMLIDLAKTGPHWTIHPLFKSNLIRYYSFNACLSNLLLEVFHEHELLAMVSSKTLFQMPERKLMYDQWKTWDFDLFEELKKDPVFPAEEESENEKKLSKN